MHLHAFPTSLSDDILNTDAESFIYNSEVQKSPPN